MIKVSKISWLMAMIAIILISTITVTLSKEAKPGCSGKAGTKCKTAKSLKDCELYAEIEYKFSTKPTQFSQTVVLDLNKMYELLNMKVPVVITVKTDRGYTKSQTFSMQRERKPKFAPILSNARCYAFTPVNKTQMDRFCKEAIDNTRHYGKATIRSEFSIRAVDLKTAKMPLAENHYKIRGKIGKDQSLVRLSP